MGVLIGWLFRGLIYLFGFFFMGLTRLLTWLSTSWSGIFILACSGFFTIFHYLSELLEYLILRFFPNLPQTNYDFSMGNEFANLIDRTILFLLNDSYSNFPQFRAVVNNLIYIVNFGEGVRLFIEVYLPFVLSIMAYKIAKSWIPTISGV